MNMKKSLCALFFLASFCSTFGQSIYKPQALYEAPGGFFDKDSLRSIHVEFEDPNYHNVLVNSFFNNPSFRIPATITLNGVAHDSVGIRYKGNSTFCLPNDAGNPKVPFNIDMNYWIGGQKLMGQKKVKLANAWLDPTFAKEFSGSQIYRNYLPTPEVNLTQLFVQGDYLGLYVNTESINKQFVEKHFNEKDGVLFKGDGAGVFCGGQSGGDPLFAYISNDSTDYYNSYTIKSDHGWAALLELINTLNFNPNELGDILNIDRVLWALAVNTVSSNLDTYNGYYVHNFYLYQTEDGLFQMIPWDLDNTFVGAILGWDFWNQQVVYEFDPYNGADAATGRPLTAYLFNNPLYRKQYTAHMRTVINEALDTATVRAKINQLQALAYNAVELDNNKQFPLDFFSSNVEEAIWVGWGFAGIMSTINERKAYLLAHPEIALAGPILNDVNIENNLLTVNASNETIVDLMLTTSEYNSKFQAYPMYDDGTNGDASAGDGIYSTVLPPTGTDDIKFYIRAQNDNAMTLSPERAEYEFYEYSFLTNTFDPTDLKNDIKVYPNPTNSTLNIEHNIEKPLAYKIVSPLGELLLIGLINSKLHEINISHLPAGVYLLSLGNEDNTFKILKTD